MLLLLSGDNYVVDDNRVTVNEDSEEGNLYIFQCKPHCTATNSISALSGKVVLHGTHWYSDDSSICLAAIHDGVINTLEGGFIKVIFGRRARIWGTSFEKGSVMNGLTSIDISELEQRVFRIERTDVSINVVTTVAGHPSAPLERGCGFQDGQPPQLAYFNRPLGIAVNPTKPLSDTVFLYVSDTDNNRIRGVSAVCTQICENGGRCSGPDQCTCLHGWYGPDCTKPICTITPAPLNHVCVAPNTYACKPGYTGPHCDVPQCIQRCLNGGKCSSPDTCLCPDGWFDANCSTPVCSITCANGG